MGLVPLSEETEMIRPHRVWTQQEGGQHRPRGGSSQEPDLDGTLISDFLASQTERNKVLLFKPPHPRPAYGILLQQLELPESSKEPGL